MIASIERMGRRLALTDEAPLLLTHDGGQRRDRTTCVVAGVVA